MSLTRELLRLFPKHAGGKVTANTAGKKRATANLTSEFGGKRRFLNNPARDSEKKKGARKNQTGC
jgi:hypothetical protein